jgi:hypothetical protein
MRQITVEVADRELTADVTFRTQEQIEERVDTMDFFRAAGEGKAKASHAAWIIYSAVKATEKLSYNDIGEMCVGSFDNYQRACLAALRIMNAIFGAGAEKRMPPSKEGGEGKK